MTFDVITEEIINLEIYHEPEIIMELAEEEIIEMAIDEQMMTGEDDYMILKNKPSINGKRLIGNYDEIDPTVPEWAKDSFKPKYTASEVGALGSDSEVSFSDLKAVWDIVVNA